MCKSCVRDGVMTAEELALFQAAGDKSVVTLDKLSWAEFMAVEIKRYPVKVQEHGRELAEQALLLACARFLNSHPEVTEDQVITLYDHLTAGHE